MTFRQSCISLNRTRYPARSEEERRHTGGKASPAQHVSSTTARKSSILLVRRSWRLRTRREVCEPIDHRGLYSPSRITLSEKPGFCWFVGYGLYVRDGGSVGWAEKRTGCSLPRTWLRRRSALHWIIRGAPEVNPEMLCRTPSAGRPQAHLDPTRVPSLDRSAQFSVAAPQDVRSSRVLPNHGRYGLTCRIVHCTPKGTRPPLAFPNRGLCSKKAGRACVHALPASREARAPARLAHLISISISRAFRSSALGTSTTSSPCSYRAFTPSQFTASGKVTVWWNRPQASSFTCSTSSSFSS